MRGSLRQIHPSPSLHERHLGGREKNRTRRRAVRKCFAGNVYSAASRAAEAPRRSRGFACPLSKDLQLSRALMHQQHWPIGLANKGLRAATEYQLSQLGATVCSQD